jgi:hypothetical protein
MKTYYIYHIPTYKWKNGRIGKIGCTDNLKERFCKYPKNTVYEVLEFHSDIFHASDREILLQRRYGYPVDTKPYWKVIQIPTKEGCSKAGKIAVESGHLKSISSMGGKIGGKHRSPNGGKIRGKISVESGHMVIMTKKSIEARRRPILQYHKDGTFIREWESALEAGNELNLHATSITQACKGKLKTTGGFVFKYKE